MEIVILVIHTLLAAALIGVVLLQPPESSGLGGLGGSNPLAGNPGRGQANLLTRATAILATGFIITSLVLAVLAGHRPQQAGVLDLDAQPAATENQTPPVVAPQAPSVPVTQ